MTGREFWRMSPHEFAKLPEASRVPRGSVLAMRPDEFTLERLRAMPIDDLRAVAMAYGAPTSGTARDLWGRILLWRDMRERLRDETVDSLSALKGRDLDAMGRRLKLYVASTKRGKAAALVGWRDQARQRGQAALAEAIHYIHVRRAVRLGLDVPEDILRHYPNLSPDRDEADMPLFAKGSP